MIFNGVNRQFIKWVADLITPYTLNLNAWERKNKLLRLAGINISPEMVLIDRHFFCQPGLEENVHIDSYCAIGSKVTLLSFGKISIGKYCMFAAGVTLVNGGHETSTFQPFSGDLTIGNGCWVGANALIVGSITVGTNSIIGAGAVVTKDVEPGSIVVGNPARIIGQREIPSRVWHITDLYFDPTTFTNIE